MFFCGGAERYTDLIEYKWWRYIRFEEKRLNDRGVLYVGEIPMIVMINYLIPRMMDFRVYTSKYCSLTNSNLLGGCYEHLNLIQFN